MSETLTPEQRNAAIKIAYADELPESQRELRGHNFWPAVAELENIPALYSTEFEGDDAGSEKTVYLHYFIGGCDWYICEIDLPWRVNPESDNTPGLAFGYSKGLGGYQGGEWGYIHLTELEEIQVNFPPFVVERDLYWEPKPFSEVI